MNALAAIHVAKKQLGLDEDTYRAVLVLVTGKSSAGAMDAAEQERVLAEFRRRGFKVVSSAREKAFAGRYVPMMQALWLSGYHLGIVQNRADAALIAFVKRQTRIDHMRWVKDAAEARRVIEALKAWMTRDAGVVWPKNADDGRSRQLAVVDAQLRLLGESPRDLSAVADLVPLMRSLGARIRRSQR